MAANDGTVDHVLPVISQSDIDQRLEERISHTLRGSVAEPHINRAPLVLALMHVSPWTSGPWFVEYTIEKTLIFNNNSPTSCAQQARSARRQAFWVSLSSR